MTRPARRPTHPCPAVGRTLQGLGLALGLAVLPAACGPGYSPDTYADTAVQQASKTERGIVIGVRRVSVTPSGGTGALTGAAAGGILGAQLPGGDVSKAFGALGGGVVGGAVGSSVERAAGRTHAFEYVVRKPDGDLVSVTQRDEIPLALGQKVLVIAGVQARIVPDYTAEIGDRGPPKAPAGDAAGKSGSKAAK